jgi:hypothetical protein
MKYGKNVLVERNHVGTFACCYAIASILGFEKYYDELFDEYLLLLKKEYSKFRIFTFG